MAGGVLSRRSRASSIMTAPGCPRSGGRHALRAPFHAPDAWEQPEAAQPADWVTYTLALQEAGVLIGGSALQGNGTATTVWVREGQRLVPDGPFAETKEHLVGYYVIDVADLDAALDWAAKVPNVRTGSVEVRPVVPNSNVATMIAMTSASAGAAAG